MNTTEKHFQKIALSNIQPSPMNPRKTFEGKKFNELVASVRKVGVIEPILVRPMSEALYEIIAGERRYRASLLIASENGGPENHQIPAMVQEMSDDDAFDLMTIENLQREDLTELEEAQGFKLYLDKKGKDALPELAERVSLTPQYISRRLMVLSLPAKALKAWEKGEIKYGHCEQLCRVKDKKLVIEYLDNLLDENNHNLETVKQLKRHIDEHAIPLKYAKFRKDEAGCLICQSNSECQSQLFEEQSDGNAYCTNSVCFKKNQTSWLTKNWGKFGKNFGTNGFRFSTDIKWSERNDFEWVGKPGEKCKECIQFITVINVEGKCAGSIKKTCIGDKSCFDQVIKQSKDLERKALKEKSGIDKENTEQDPNTPRVSWHGQHFREEFYKEHIPEAISSLNLDDLRCQQLSLLAVLQSNSDSRVAFAREWLPKYADKDNLTFWDIKIEKIWQKVLAMTTEEIAQAHRDIAGAIIMQENTFTADYRHRIAKILNIDLSKSWRITKEYLDKKTTKEILNVIAKFGIDKSENALTFLHENLNKKRGRFDTCKKAELVSIFLDSGLDLAGIVPDEILNV